MKNHFIKGIKSGLLKTRQTTLKKPTLWGLFQSFVPMLPKLFIPTLT